MAEAAEQPGPGRSVAPEHEHAEAAAGDVRVGRCRDHRHRREGVRQRRGILALELRDVARVEDELVAAGAGELEDAREQVLLARVPPGGSGTAAAGAEPGEERCRCRVVSVEADAEVRVERLEQRHRPLLVALAEPLHESLERLILVRAADPPEEVDAAQDLVDDLPAEHGLRARLRQVDLKEPVERDGRGQRLEAGRDAAIAIRRDAQG